MTTEEKIKDVLKSQVSPALASHGGFCTFENFDEPTATAYVAMEGACGSCPVALVTLRMMVEETVVSAIPEVKAVERA